MELRNLFKDTATRALVCADIGISQQALSNWLARKNVPAEYCPRIEALTGIRCEDLRPDVQWSVLTTRQPAEQEV